MKIYARGDKPALWKKTESEPTFLKFYFKLNETSIFLVEVRIQQVLAFLIFVIPAFRCGFFAVLIFCAAAVFWEWDFARFWFFEGSFYALNQWKTVCYGGCRPMQRYPPPVAWNNFFWVEMLKSGKKWPLFRHICMKNAEKRLLLEQHYQ